MPGEQPPAGTPANPHDLPTPPLEVAPTPPPAPVQQPSMVAAGGDQCPNCQATMAADQRYCLECGHRRGDPRLPFMDAVVFMEAARQPSGGAAAPPPPPRERKPRISANASLIAGIATLILAIGVGVLIGRSGNSGTTSAANATPQIIKVGGGTETESSSPTESSGNGKKGKGSGKSKKANAKAETGSSGTSKGVEEVIKPEAGVKIAPPKTQVGGKCEKGTAGCTGEKFTGEFFGE